ncbi:glycosyltransferase family 2 protein, partial [Patescibacteria group bacterium]
IKQRSRWDQGFLQAYAKKDWQKLKTAKQRFLMAYLLLQTILRHVATINMLLMPIIALGLKTNVLITTISFIPAYFLVAQLGLYVLGMSDLKNQYKIKVPTATYLKTIVFFLPYQVMLALSSAKAMFNILVGKNYWEKTTHHNLHRQYLNQ